MNKIIFIILIFSLLLSGCASFPDTPEGIGKIVDELDRLLPE